MWWWLGCHGGNEPEDTSRGRRADTGTVSACAGPVEYLYDEDRTHIEGGVDYADRPPTSGPHDPCWADWGVHATPVADENWVHNLEHGGVVFLYNCVEGCEPEVAELAAMVELLGPFALLTPYPDLTWRFGAVSWGARREFDCVDVAAMTGFYEAHRDHAPESNASNPGGECM